MLRGEHGWASSRRPDRVDQGVAILRTRPRPLCIPAHRWQIFIEDCRGFVACPWAERAADLGWDASSLFGSRFQPLHEHLGQAGLLPNLFGGAIVQIYKDGATILDPNGRSRNHHPCRREPECWVIERPTSRTHALSLHSPNPFPVGVGGTDRDRFDCRQEIGLSLATCAGTTPIFTVVAP